MKPISSRGNSMIATVPIRIREDAQAWIAAQGMQREFEEMLAYTRRAVSGLHAVEVVLDPDPGHTIGPGIIIWSYREDATAADALVERQWGEWKVNTFPPEVCLNFVMLTGRREEAHERPVVSGRGD
jgi:hypothetical protein